MTTKKLNLSDGNLKMKKGFAIWNIPEKKTCPGSTAMCRKHCYACKASKRFPSTVPASREANLDASKSADFTKNMISSLKAKKCSFVRIHESGDFYSQKYLDAWKTIARAIPNKRFLAFTKSFSFDFSDCPENMQIIASIWPDTDMSTVPAGWPRAYAGDCGGGAIECPGQCDGCGLCWHIGEVGINVHFNIH